MDFMAYEIYLDKNLIEKITKYAMQRSRKAWPIMNNRKINRNSPRTDWQRFTISRYRHLESINNCIPYVQKVKQRPKKILKDTN